MHVIPAAVPKVSELMTVYVVPKRRIFEKPSGGIWEDEVQIYGCVLQELKANVAVQKLRHMRAQNPIYPQFQPMQLYDKTSVRRCGFEKQRCSAAGFC